MKQQSFCTSSVKLGEVIISYKLMRHNNQAVLIFKFKVVYLFEPLAVTFLEKIHSLSHQNTIGKGVCICCKQPVYLLFNLLLLVVV